MQKEIDLAIEDLEFAVSNYRIKADANPIDQAGYNEAVQRLGKCRVTLKLAIEKQEEFAANWKNLLSVIKTRGMIEIWDRPHTRPERRYYTKFQRFIWASGDSQPPLDGFEGQSVETLLTRIIASGTGGETFRPRGLGRASGQCFVCGKPNGPEIVDMASFIEDKKAGARVLQMFVDAGLTAEIDYRPSEPRWVQCKLCVCTDHEPCLRELMRLTSEDGKIDSAKIKAALKAVAND